MACQSQKPEDGEPFTGGMVNHFTNWRLDVHSEPFTGGVTLVTLTVMVYILLRVNITPPESYHYVSWAAQCQRDRRRGETTKGRQCARGNRGRTLRGRRARRSLASQDDPLQRYAVIWVDSRRGMVDESKHSTESRALLA